MPVPTPRVRASKRDVAALVRGGDVRLVGGLVLAEAHVSVRAEDLPGAELGLELGQQLLHRAAHGLLVDGLVLVPVGLGVVVLEAFEELDRFCRPALERHVSSLGRAGTARARRRARRPTAAGRGRVRPRPSSTCSSSWRTIARCSSLSAMSSSRRGRGWRRPRSCEVGRVEHEARQLGEALDRARRWPRGTASPPRSAAPAPTGRWPGRPTSAASPLDRGLHAGGHVDGRADGRPRAPARRSTRPTARRGGPGVGHRRGVGAEADDHAGAELAAPGRRPRR